MVLDYLSRHRDLAPTAGAVHLLACTKFTAAEAGYVQRILEKATAAGVDLCSRDKQRTPLEWAAACGNLVVVEALLRAGADRYGRPRALFVHLGIDVRKSLAERCCV